MQNCKKIVYLDQLFVSNMAKALYVSDWKDKLKPFYRELYTLLSSLTDCDKLICPTSAFHREESELGYKVKEFLWHFVEQLGYGLSFKDSLEIRKYQVFSEARAYCALQDTQSPAFEVAFNRNPQIAVEHLSKPTVLVSIPDSQEFNEYMRLSKASIADQYWNYKEYCRGKRKAYAAEVAAQKKQLILEMFMPPPQLSIKASRLEQFLNLLGRAGVIDLYHSVQEMLQNSTNPLGFWVSPHLLDCPFIPIWASLMAADVFFHPEKKPTASLFTDFEIVATVLPYVDILATDKYIYELIRKAGLSNRFSAHIFTIRQREALIAQLRSL